MTPGNRRHTVRQDICKMRVKQTFILRFTSNLIVYRKIANSVVVLETGLLLLLKIVIFLLS